ncbi:MAG TPA: folylpolyglutamate synthase/dihydrofolate synthase family protein, partial [Candidatus Saccharimonadales bacterium]|nr:folylpolyglutamate synthase/dihydrofolate synthase family protein [Candidatus Saccharimonadales bacterium]
QTCKMLYEQAIEFLYGLRLFGAKMGLENTRRLAALCGNPQERLRFIHVAGTNGKGSTCAMLESIYRAQGLKTGLFTSPHLVSFRERIQVNRQLIPEAEVARLVEGLQQLLGAFPRESHPTFFEVVTIVALQWFAEQKCDIVIWETGLGGRLDATNIVTPLASVITNIDLDHQQWLGDTIQQIASEKAGIIKEGVPVVTAARSGRGLEVILEAARKLQSPATVVKDGEAADALLKGITLPLIGSYQRTNAALAITTVRLLAKQLPTSEKALRTGLADVHWPGRMQVVRYGQETILLDGAHNPAGAELLAHHIPEFFPRDKPVLIMGVLGDKDWEAMARALAPKSEKIFLPRLKSDRALSPATLERACLKVNPLAKAQCTESFQEALGMAKAAPGIVITGSLYLIGEALECLGLSVTPAISERGLNEYGVKP